MGNAGQIRSRWRIGGSPYFLGQFIAYAVVIGGAILVFIPFFWMVMTSFKTAPEIQRLPLQILPASFRNWSNYVTVLTRVRFLSFILNTAIVTAISVTTSLLVSSLAGYGFSKFRFPGRNILFFAVISLLMVPFQSIAIPLYQWATRLGLVDTYLGVALPQMVSAFGVYLMREACEQIPNDYIDAARIDGCSELRIFTTIVLPNVKPYLATLAIIKFMWVWNEFFWPLIIITSEERKVVTLGLTAFTNMYFTEYELAAAGAILSMLPVLIFFLAFQRLFVRAVTYSGLKG